MKICLWSACQLALLSLCCVLMAVRESDGSFVPGRCLCPSTQDGVRGPLKDLKVYPRSPSCDKVTVIVTLKSDSQEVCINPNSPVGKKLVRCWNRAQKQGRDAKLCLKRRRKGKGRPAQMQFRSRSRGQNRKTSSPS
ncbi:growth-regulated alpha protein-like [Nelusetta ayraudi]|uniref:growth-regulated alpha protein-like n=1 Tax=Nelusetta ayraudi TaxID=303726 RepID=UPI003F718066